MKRLTYGILAICGLFLAALSATATAGASDHLEAPRVQQDGRTDIADVYAFQSPENEHHTILIMTVNPGAGVLSPETFDPRANYQFKIDNDGDALPDRTIGLRFTEVLSDGEQSYRIFGMPLQAKGRTGTIQSLGRSTAGVFDDPFFFDFQAFQDQVKGAGGSRTFCDGHETDFFAGLNVSAIVLEVPSAWLTNGSESVGVWAQTTTRDGQRIDRAGRPAIATVLINDGSEDRFNRTHPKDDRAYFGDQVTNNLLALSGLDGSGYTQAEAAGITDLLLPDILTFNTQSTDGYLNGRGLADDVIDTSLTVVTGGLGANGTPVLTSDCVDANDVPFNHSFPFLAEAHE